MNNQLPAITQHSAVFRCLAPIAGRLFLCGAVILYAITGQKRKPRTRALIAWNGKILLVRNVADHNRWTLPGGGVKPGEDYAESIAREIGEELSIRQPAAKFRLIKHYDKTEVGESYDKICYLLDLSKSRSLKITLSSEILEARWFSVNRLPDRLSPVVQLAVYDYFARQFRNMQDSGD